ncbi:MAG: LytTR family DNA-binding domain-containing protein [Pseudomonadota bacterium]
MQERFAEISEWWRITADKARTVTPFRHFQSWKIGDSWLLAIFLGLGGAFAGPYGTFFALNFLERVVYWEVGILVSFALWRGTEHVVRRRLNLSSHLAISLFTIPIFSAGNSAFLYLLHHLMEVSGIARLPVPLAGLFVGHLLMSTVVVTPSILLVRRMRMGVESKAGGDAIRFLTERLPAKLRGEKPFALAAEGHYVRVYTNAGNDLITMRFEDAVSAVVGIDGVQTHRSWWVATEAVRSIQKAGSAFEAVLSSGLQVPVSRRRKPQVAQALLDGTSSPNGQANPSVS